MPDLLMRDFALFFARCAGKKRSESRTAPLFCFFLSSDYRLMPQTRSRLPLFYAIIKSESRFEI